MYAVECRLCPLRRLCPLAADVIMTATELGPLKLRPLCGRVIPLRQEQEQQEQAQEYGEPLGRQSKTRKEVLVKQMGDRGWVTKVTEIPLPVSPWGDADRWRESEDYVDYMNERDDEELSDYYP